MLNALIHGVDLAFRETRTQQGRDNALAMLRRAIDTEARTNLDIIALIQRDALSDNPHLKAHLVRDLDTSSWDAMRVSGFNTEDVFGVAPRYLDIEGDDENLSARVADMRPEDAYEFAVRKTRVLRALVRCGGFDISGLRTDMRLKHISCALRRVLEVQPC